MQFKIRPSCSADAPHLPAIERSAGHLFRTIPDLAWIAEGDDMPVARHLELIAAGTSWVAEGEDGGLAAFLCAEAADDALHINELAVVLAHQRQGIGRALLAEAIAFARLRHLAFVTLTTFRALAWNEPYYQGLGFVTLQSDGLDARLDHLLAAEASAGLPRAQRCAMRLALSATVESHPTP